MLILLVFVRESAATSPRMASPIIIKSLLLVATASIVVLIMVSTITIITVVISAVATHAFSIYCKIALLD